MPQNFLRTTQVFLSLLVCSVFFPSTAVFAISVSGNGYTVNQNVTPINSFVNGGGYNVAQAGQPISGLVTGGGYNSQAALPSGTTTSPASAGPSSPGGGVVWGVANLTSIPTTVPSGFPSSTPAPTSTPTNEPNSSPEPSTMPDSSPLPASTNTNSRDIPSQIPGTDHASAPGTNGTSGNAGEGSIGNTTGSGTIPSSQPSEGQSVTPRPVSGSLQNQYAICGRFFCPCNPVLMDTVVILSILMLIWKIVPKSSWHRYNKLAVIIAIVIATFASLGALLCGHVYYMTATIVSLITLFICAHSMGTRKK